MGTVADGLAGGLKPGGTIVEGTAGNTGIGLTLADLLIHEGISVGESAGTNEFSRSKNLPVPSWL